MKKGDPKKGVYVIYAKCLNKDNCLNKAYIGSSSNIQHRINEHLRMLQNQRHYNTKMQAAFNSNDYEFSGHILEECGDDYQSGDELKLETKYLNQQGAFCFSTGSEVLLSYSLFNQWAPPTFDEIKPHLDSVLHRIHPGMYTITKNGCWEWNVVHKKSGYGNTIQTSLGPRGAKKTKYIAPHRLSYYKYKGEYPELVRHKCDNKLCVNPDHLESGSHRDNALDKNKQFRKDFEAAWLKFEGNAVELTKHFEFKPNCGWVDGVKTISTSIYGWERKLGLRDKYPHIMSSRKFMSPHGQEAARRKQIKKLEILKRQAEKIKRQNYLDSITGDVIATWKIFGNAYSKEDLAYYFHISQTEIRKILEGVPSSFDVLMQSGFFGLENNINPHLYSGLDQKLQMLEEAKLKFPEIAEDLDYQFYLGCYPDEYGRQDRKLLNCFKHNPKSKYYWESILEYLGTGLFKRLEERDAWIKEYRQRTSI